MSTFAETASEIKPAGADSSAAEVPQQSQPVACQTDPIDPAVTSRQATSPHRLLGTAEMATTITFVRRAARIAAEDVLRTSATNDVLDNAKPFRAARAGVRVHIGHIESKQENFLVAEYVIAFGEAIRDAVRS
jgi:hypothetical protein